MLLRFNKILYFCAFFVFGMILLATNSIYGQTSLPNNSTPPYEQELLRIAEIIGALEYLHPLCNRQEIGVWKDQMANFLEAETTDARRRARFTAYYNRSYITLKQLHHKCTQSAELIIARYEQEARNLTDQLSKDYAPQNQQSTDLSSSQPDNSQNVEDE